MPINEIPNPRSVTRDSNGTHTRTRTFRYTGTPLSEPPLSDSRIPQLGTPHPTDSALTLRRYQADPVGITDGWTIQCEYSNFTTSGTTSPRPDPREVGSWIWHETIRVNSIHCPIARLTSSKLPDINNPGHVETRLHYALDTTLTDYNEREFTISIVSWSPSLGERMAIGQRLNQIHKFGDDPQEYRYMGCDTELLGLGMRGDDYSAQIVRFIHKWDGDSGSWPMMSTEGWWNVSSRSGAALPALIMPNDGSGPLYRPPHHIWAMAPSASQEPGAFPEFSVLRKVPNDPSNYGEWRGLPGMEYVVI